MVIIIRLVTVHMPPEFLHGLDELVRLQKYPNRSEAIRVAIRDLLKDELWHSRLAQTAKIS
jgi:Arc/MetJ-type ribon-helix-helix transcriptional regulator